MSSSTLKKRPLAIPAFAAMVVVCAFLAASPAPSQAPPGPGFAEIERTALDLGARFGPDRVLLVFDLDNTLLRMNQDFGSDEWYTWQRDLDDGDPAKIRSLLELQGLLFDLSGMHPPEPGVQPRVVAGLQDRGFAAIVLTGRGPDNRGATERELARNGYDFARTAVPPREGYGGSFAPFDPRNVQASGFVLPCDRDRGTFPASQPVSYQNGIMMTAGQDKGLMLRALLDRCGRHYAAVLFVDDSERNLQAVARAFSCTSVDVTTVLYARGRAAAGIDKDLAAAQFRKLRAVLGEIFSRDVN
jgi:hypothetical protein